MENPTKVYDAWNTGEAHLLCELLENAGIPARVESDAANSMAGAIPFQSVTCPVWVDEANEIKARAIIESFVKERSAPEEDTQEELFCYHCGELVELNESPCHTCGKELQWNQEPDEEE